MKTRTTCLALLIGLLVGAIAPAQWIGGGPSQQTQDAVSVAQVPADRTFQAAENDIARLIREKGWLLAIVSIFLLGLALNLAPCVYPMIPITIGYFSNQSDGKKSRMVVLALLYMLGIAVTYSVLGVVAALTGQMLGAWLQNSLVLVFVAALMAALALSLFGVYQFRLPSFLMRKVPVPASAGMLGALGMGLVVGIVAAPCVGPVTVALLAYVGSTGNPWLGFWLFFTLAIGLGTPYVLLGIFSGALKRLPRSGVWMVWVEHLLGLVLLGMALYFLAPLLPKKAVPWLVLILAVSGGVYLGWLDKSSTGGRAFNWLKKAVGAAAIALGVFSILPTTSTAAITWGHYEPAVLERARQAGQPAILDFSADWCLPCQEMNRFTFTDPRVVAASKALVMVKVDVTQPDTPEVAQVLQEFGVSGVPTVLFLDGQGRELTALRLEGYEGPEKFLERMKRASGGS